MTTKLAVGTTFLLAALAIAACDATGDPPAGAATGQPAQPGQTAPSASAAPVEDHDHHGKHEGCGDDCGDPTAPADTVATATDPATGKPMQLIGAPLAGLYLVKIVDLAARPDDFAGKTVRVEGDVLGMCHHKRAWFAVQDEGDRSGGFVRVVTAPKFLVPAGSIGKKARVEGTIEVVEVPAERAKYFAKSHNMGDPDKITGPVKHPILRANGAELL